MTVQVSDNNNVCGEFQENRLAIKNSLDILAQLNYCVLQDRPLEPLLALHPSKEDLEDELVEFSSGKHRRVFSNVRHA